MCGRYSLGLSHHDIQENIQNDYPDIHLDDDWVNQDAFVPRHNIAPRSQAPVIRRRDSSSTSSESQLHTMKWGLVPHWSKYEDKTLNTTNARAENVVEGGGMWASLRGKKRCVVVCEGYYEWLTKGKDKLPHFTKHKKGKMMLLAGLYDSVVLEGTTEPLWTFTIVTTAANKEFSWLHDRQPVILSSSDALNTWLDTTPQSWTSELTKLVRPYHDLSSPLECYQVPKEVGKVGTESSTFIEPISSRKDGIQAMFSKQKQRQQTSTSGTGSGTTSTPKPKPTPTSVRRKRSRSASPSNSKEVIDLTLDNPPEAKKAKVDSDDDVVVIDDSKAKIHVHSPSVSPAKSKSKASPSKPRKEKSSPTKMEGPSGSKITGFFSKS